MNSIFESKYSESQRQYKLIREFDPLIIRVDTCLAIKLILKDIQKVLDQINNMPLNERLENYFHTYNGVLFILDIYQDLKKSQFAFEAIEFLLMAITSLQGNLILQDAKYLDLRTKLYIQTAKLYQEQQAYPAAINVLTSGVQKFSDLMSLHELDSPIPEHIRIIISNDIKLLKIMLIKYKIQGGTIPVVDFKKKVDEQFLQDQELKLICLIECLRTKRNKKISIFQQRKTSFKDNLVNIGYQMIKGDIEIIATSLQQQKIKIQKAVELQNSINLNLTQQQINQQIKKKREIEQKFIKQKDYSKAVKNVPLQYHCQLIHYAFEVKNNKIFNELSQWAVVRIKYRSVQVPYITDISIITSDTTTPNIPNQYEKLPYDLNEANLKLELNKLRNSGKINPDLQSKDKEKEPLKQAPKDAKKQGKDSKAPVATKQQTKKQLATPWEFEQIKHKYVYLLVKKSVYPEKAIYGINIALGNQDKGPIGNNQIRKIAVPHIRQNVSVKSAQVQQYTGVRSTTNLIPFLILFHSSNSLSDEEQRKTVITDIKPIFGKNPMIRPALGYDKIDLDLRQVPNQFIRSKFHQYVYLTYKTDGLFNIQQRHTQILISLNQLESTYGKSNNLANTIQQQKLLELGIDYSLQSLNAFFETTYKNLGGALGQEYYITKTDFLTELCSYIWIKYMRQPLCQFDYLMEQRLTGQCNEYDYAVFKSIINKSKPIFLIGLKIMNLVFASNNKSDLLLLCKVNLELAKILEEDFQFLIGIQNIKVCLQSIDKYRNNYLKCGIQGKYDKLLPFSITTSNMKLEETLGRIKQKYLEDKKAIAKMLRIRKRKQNGDKKLTQKQLKQEEFQFEVKYNENKIQNDITEFQVQRHSEIYLTVVAVETELINCLIRLELKEGQKGKKLVKQRKRNNPNSKGFEQFDEPITMKLKSSLVQQDTEIQVKKNLSEYQGTLQKAGKIEPTKPAFASYQSKLINQTNKNPYKQAILLLNLGSINTKTQQRKYLFQECLKTILKAYEQQEFMLNKAIQNSIYLISRIYDKDLSKPSSIQIYPFSQVYSNDWVAQSNVPISPILISKTSNSITMKLPPFIPLVKQKDPAELKLKKTIQSMTLYGKLSANGVDVSANSISLEGTGIKRSNSSVVQVKNLETNNIYCFACSATNAKNQQGGIGKTGENIGAYNPLPLNIILGCLAKVTFQLNEYQISKNATQKIIDQYCQVTNYLDKNSQVSYLNYYKFKDGVLQGLSKIQLQYLAQSIYIAARCKNLIPDKNITESQKQHLITNLIMLANFLAPLLGTPLSSLPYFIPEESVIERGLSINLLPSKWISPNLRLLSSKIMYNVLKWGLQNNEINLSRRITYKWIQRKWMLLGKLIQIQQKKQVKKGTKQSKDQQIKLIDKYVRMLVEKSPGVMDKFEDALIMLHQEYSDYVISSIERTKEQIQFLSQYIDNPIEELQRMTIQLNTKLQFIQYLKDPIPNITKIPQTSFSYLEYSCKLLRRSLQKRGDTKMLIQSSNQIVVDYSNPIIKISKEMQQLTMQAIKNDIDWAPQSVKQLRIFQQKTGEDISKTINIFQKYNELQASFNRLVKQEPITLDKNKQFRYNATWISELNYLKALTLIIEYTSKTKSKAPQYQQGYYNINTLSLEQIIKKRKQIEVMDKANYMESAKNLEQLSKIVYLLSEAVYYTSIVSNWSILQNILKTLYNLLSYCQLTPFSHTSTSIYQHLTLISIVSIQMLKKIKSEGYHKYRKEYQSRLKQKELALIQSKLNIGNSSLQNQNQRRQSIDQKHYFRPSLETKTSKTFWFKQVPELELEVVISVVCYNIQCLLIQNKHSLEISVIRQFSNITNHIHSLSVLPFLINSQQKILEKVYENLNIKKQQLNDIQLKYNNWKASKKKGSRQAQITGEKFEQQIQYQQNKLKLNQTIKLIEQKVNFLKQEQSLSLKIIEQIKRDSNQISLKQKQNHRLLIEFSKDQTRMLKQYGDENRLINNRKNTFKQLLSKYNKVLQLLQSSKDSKDELSEIQNLNEAGNLAFAVQNIEAAEVHWIDCLSIIMKFVNPIINYRQIIQSKEPSPIEIIGLKQSLLAINILKKLSTVCYSKNLHMKRQTIFMSSTLIKSIFKLDSNHPTLLEHYNLYRLKEISSKSINELRDNVTINLSELLDSCQLISWGMIDYDKSILALPTICLMQHLSIDIVKNPHYSMRSKLLKSLSSSLSGYIKQSIVSLLKCFYQKDLPIKWIEQTEYLKREEGMNWPVEEMIYNNSLPPYQKQNNQILQQLFKLDLNKKFEATYGFMNGILFEICKAMILFSANQIEIAGNYELNEQRAVKLINAQNILRSCLKKLSLLEECSTLLQYFKEAQIGYKLDQTNDDKKKKLEESKSNVTKYLKSQGTTDQSQINNYFALQPTVQRRIQRLDLIARVRTYISKINQSRCLWTRSFYILKNGLWNLYYYSINARNIETGEQKENEELVVASQTKPAGNAAKKDDKKGAKKDTKQQIKQESVIKIDESKLLQQTNKLKQRTTISYFWHLKLKLEIVSLLYKQNRFKQALVLSKQITTESDEYNDYYFSLIAEGFTARCKIKLGQSIDSKEMEKIIIRLQQNNLTNSRMFLELVGDCAELLSAEAAQKLLSQKQEYLENLAEQIGVKSYVLSENNNNNSKQYCTQLELSAQVQQEIKRKTIRKQIDAKKGGKQEKKPAVKKQDLKKKKQEQRSDYKIQTLAKVEWTNLNSQQKSTYVNINPQINSTQKQINCYLKQTQLYIKYKLRKIEKHLEFELRKMNGKDIDAIKSQLKNIDKIVSHSYGLNQGLILIFRYLQSRIMQSQLALRFNEFISLNKDNLSPKIIKRYSEGLPLDPNEITVPSFEQFIHINKSIIESIIQKLKQCTNLIKNQCILYQFNFNIHRIFFYLGYNYLLLARYQGKATPKYIELQLSKSDALQQQMKSKKIRLMQESKKYLQLGIEIKNHKRQLNDNYCELGKKPFEIGTYKIDPAIEAEILQIDYLCRKQEIRIQNELNLHRFRKEEDNSIKKQGTAEISFDESKKKTAINFIDILTFILKLHRQAKMMTFSSSHLQNAITKCHKILFNLLPLYKQKCVLKDVDKKTEKIENDSIVCSIENVDNKCMILYILGFDSTPDSFLNTDQQEITQGHISVSKRFMNQMSCLANNLKQKMESSDKKSVSQKQRDYRLHNEQYERILKKFVEEFIDQKSKSKEGNLKQFKQLVPELNYGLVQFLINIFEGKGVNEINKPMNRLFRYANSLNISK